MKTIERYVVGSFLTAFFLSWLVLTFVLSIGLLVKVTSLMARGMPVAVVGRYFLTGIPETLGFTIPIAVLVGAMLVFGRLSADSEIAAMRACGINLLRIMFWPLLFALGMSMVCYYIQSEVAPGGEEERTRLASETSTSMGIDLMEPGVFNEGPNHMRIWFAARVGNELTDLRIYDKTKAGLDREIRAERARITRKGNDLLLDLYEAGIDPFYEDRPGAAKASRFSHVVPDAFRQSNRPRRVRNCGSRDLLRMLPEAVLLNRHADQASAVLQSCPLCRLAGNAARPTCRKPVHELARSLRDTAGFADPKLLERLRRTCPACVERRCLDAGHGRILLAARAIDQARTLPTEIRIELHKRLALSCAAFCFALIGIPLGIRAHRRESTLGVAIGLGIALLFYLAMILADALKKSPDLHPYWIVWVPILLCCVVAAFLIPKNQ
jgi:lipopolysaccharide export system permease protein